MKNFTLLLLAIILIGCNNSREVSRALSSAENIMTESPDSARLILANISRSSLKSRAAKARHALLYSQALDKCYVDVDNDSLTSIALDYYKSHGSDHEKALAYYYNGIVVLNKNGETEQIIDNMVAAQHHAENTDDTYLKGLISFILGKQYYNQLSFEEALSNFDIAVTCFRELDLKQNLLLSLQYKGISQNMLNMYDEAITTLYNAKDLAIQNNDISRLLNIYQNIYYIKIKYSDIYNLPTIKKELSNIYHKYNNGIVPFEHYLLWSNIHLKIEDYNTAKEFAQKFVNSNYNIKESNIGGYYQLAKIEFALNNNTKAYSLLDKYIHLNDSLNNIKQSTLVQSLEQKYHTKYIKDSLINLQKQHQMTNKIYALITSLILLTIFFAYYKYRQTANERLQKIREYEQYIDEVTLVKNELIQKCELLTNSINTSDNRMNRLHQLLTNRIQSLQYLSNLAVIYEHNTNKFYTKVKEHMALSRKPNDDMIVNIIDIANECNNGFASHFESLHPQVSKYELCFCCLLSMGFSTESIRVLFNHTHLHSVYSMSSRIRNKIQLPSEIGTIEKYVQDITSSLKSKDIH